MYMYPTEWVRIALIRDVRPWNNSHRGHHVGPTAPRPSVLPSLTFTFSWQVGMKTFQKWLMKLNPWATQSWWRAHEDTKVSAVSPGLPWGLQLYHDKTRIRHGRSTAQRNGASPRGACCVVLTSVPSSLSPLSLLSSDPSTPFPGLWQ